MSLRADIVALLKPTGDTVWFDDAGVAGLVALLRPLEGSLLLDAGYDLLRVAHFLEVEKRSPAAAATLLTLVAASGPAFRAADKARAEALVSQAAPMADRLAAFSGDARVTKVLDSGARPEGTVPAGPLARFVVQKK